jgi:hypothetical protein
MRRFALFIPALLSACVAEVSQPASEPDAAPAPDARVPPPCLPPIAFPDGLYLELVDAPAEGPFRVEITAGDESALLEVEVIIDSPSSTATRCVTTPVVSALGCMVETPSYTVEFSPRPRLSHVINVRNSARPGGPAELTVTVTSGEATATATLQPAYETTYLGDDEACGFVSRATVALALATPGA